MGTAKFPSLDHSACELHERIGTVVEGDRVYLLRMRLGQLCKMPAFAQGHGKWFLGDDVLASQDGSLIHLGMRGVWTTDMHHTDVLVGHQLTPIPVGTLRTDRAGFLPGTIQLSTRHCQ